MISKALVYVFYCRIAEHGVSAAGAYAVGAHALEFVGCLAEGSGSVDDVVHDHHVGSFHVAYHLDGAHLILAGTGFVADDDGGLGAAALLEAAGIEVSRVE